MKICFFLLLQQSAAFITSIFWNLVAPCPHTTLCALISRITKKRKEKKQLLPSEKEESQTLVRALILILNAYN